MLTVATELQVEDIANLDVDYTEEALIASFELALIKYLHGDNRGVLDGAVGTKTKMGGRRVDQERTCRNSRSSKG